MTLYMVENGFLFVFNENGIQFTENGYSIRIENGSEQDEEVERRWRRSGVEQTKELIKQE